MNKLESEILKFANWKINKVKPIMLEMTFKVRFIVIPFAGPNAVYEKLYYDSELKKFSHIEYPIYNGKGVEYKRIELNETPR